MEKTIQIVIGVVVLEAIVWALFPTFVTFLTNAQLNNVTLLGADYSWAKTLGIVMYVLIGGLLPIGALIYVVKSMGKA